MTMLLVVCLGAVLSLPVNATFTLAERVGNPPRAFFRFSTSVAKYTIRYDGFVEVYANNNMNHLRKRGFFLSMTPKGRLENVYFLEHEGDLWMRYDLLDGRAYLMRMEQRSRRQRWVTPLNDSSGEAPVILGDKVLIGTTEIRKSDGRVVNQD